MECANAQLLALALFLDVIPNLGHWQVRSQRVTRAILGLHVCLQSEQTHKRNVAGNQQLDRAYMLN